jgi:hypothetical protein
MPIYRLIRAFGKATRPEGRQALSDQLTEAVVRSNPAQAARQEVKIIATQGQPDSGTDAAANLEELQHAALEIFTYLLYAVIAVLIGGAIYCAIIATRANGLVLVSILLFGAAGLVFSEMENLQRMLTSSPVGGKLSLASTKNPTIARQTVVRMDKAALETARGLKKAGKDIDEICRTVQPAYAGWGSLQQTLFRDALKVVLQMTDENAGKH